MNKTPVIAVIGCGNIGSRHLQGLARLTHAAAVYAVDPVETSRKLSAERVTEIGPRNDVSFSFHPGMDTLPENIDLAIVATGSGPRRALTERLLGSRKVTGLILEKFLFRNHADHIAVADLIAAKQVPTWVNTPRRAWPVYRALAAELQAQGPLTIAVELGRTNPLGTNAIHFIDLAAYLAGPSVRFELDGRGLKPQTEASRHKDGLEFSGVLTGRSERGDALVVTSRLDSTAPHLIVIHARDRRLVIDEAREKVLVANTDNTWTMTPDAFPIVRQSSLTNEFAESVVAGAQPPLPDYAESARLHRQCLSAFLQAMGRDPQALDAVVPVT